jgi:16S rRNA (guanine527-N7)-methyltransferase
MDNTIRNTLSRGAAEIGVPLGADQLDLFAAYHRELLLWNRRINLISEKSSREILIRHFVDSLTPVPWIARPEGLLIDLGSGGGFPGIPLRIALPNLRPTLVEASRKKSSFLSHIVRTLALGDTTVVRERVEVLIGEKACDGGFDTVISRAAFKLPELIRMAAFLLSPGGLLIAMKGPDPQEEMAAAETLLTASGMVREDVHDIRLPVINLSKKIIIYKRVAGKNFH